ncbi:MAG: hypothetical protein KIT14_08430 [bacterium]|nr:hypothetical protein [bacterium]
MSRGWLYACACIVVPAAWGVLVAAVFNRIDRRRGRRDGRPVDYAI